MPVRPLVMILSYRVDPDGVLDVLGRVSPDVVVSYEGTTWVRADVPATPDRPRLTMLHDPELYSGPDWPRHLLEIRDRLAAFPPTPQRATIMRGVAGLQFMVSVDPACLLDLDGPDPRASIVYAVADHLDAFVLTGSGLRDRVGRVLLGHGRPDPGAVLPHAASVMPSSEMLADRSALEDQPPSPDRVARRALALAALSSRAFLEQMDRTTVDVEMERVKLHAWVDAVGIGDEIEPDEWQILQTRVGLLDERRAVDAAWRFEGLTVLAWALGRAEVPPDHQLVEATRLFPSIGFLDFDASLRLISEAEVRDDAEIELLRDRLALLHARLRELRMVKRQKAFSRAARAAMVEQLGDVPNVGEPASATAVAIDPAFGASTAEEVHQIENIVLERLVAAEWLLEGGRYSQVGPLIA
ncbi:MAG: DUF4272 domain-containing protein [Acidimicrobiales bacterium]|nr:DUF4272 domain-containing protein [Acidimicrobiales bacterium]